MLLDLFQSSYFFNALFTTTEKMRLKLACSLLFLSTILVSEPLTIKGIVKDLETHEPIPFAHVVVGDIISLTNLDGEFVISASTVSNATPLQVSVMGYDLGSEKIANADEFHTIYLKPSTTALDEVMIISGQILMDKVFSRFHLNYEMSRQHMIGYYKEDLHDRDSMYYIAEGIVDIYIPPNIEFDEALVSPIKTRKKVFKSIDEQIMFLKGNASDMAKSSIWRKNSFLSSKHRKNYDFIYTGMSQIGDQEVLIVEFEPINGKGNTNGRIFIEEKSLAVIKLEYHPEVTKTTLWKDVTWTEEFYEKDGMYELFRVSYEGSWDDYDKVYDYSALLVVNESTPTTNVPISKNLLSENHSFFDEADDDFSDSFWEGYNYVKLDVESALLLNKQGLTYSY